MVILVVFPVFHHFPNCLLGMLCARTSSSSALASNYTSVFWSCDTGAEWVTVYNMLQHLTAFYNMMGLFPLEIFFRWRWPVDLLTCWPVDLFSLQWGVFCLVMPCSLRRLESRHDAVTQWFQYLSMWVAMKYHPPLTRWRACFILYLDSFWLLCWQVLWFTVDYFLTLGSNTTSQLGE